jgi:hypothetical protein
MNNSEIKALIKSKLEEKKILGDILKELQVEHNINITFMELKMLAAEIDDFDWSTLDKKVEKKPEDKENIEESSGTVIEINKIARPDAMMHGSVKFASGATADWLLDSYGRLTLDNKIGDPTAEDIEEFQLELQKALSK